MNRHGSSAQPMEKARSNQWAEHMCTMGTVTTLDENQGDDEYTDFWDILGEGTIAEAMQDDDGVREFEPLLFRVDGDLSKDLELVATGKSIEKTSKTCSCLNRSDLNDDDVFLIDSGWEIYVWVGKGADRREKIAAMSTATSYSKKDPRTLELPVHIVKSGHESDSFNALFA
jgi:gelsolin